MATRLYTSADSQISVPAGTNALAAWTVVASGAFGRLAGRPGDDFSGSSTITSGASNPTSKCCKRFATPPLQGQTIPSGTIKGQFRCNETSTGGNAQLAFALCIVKSDGSLRSVWLDVTNSDDNSATPPEMAVTTATNRKLRDTSENVSIAIPSVDVEGGDVISLEVGFKAFSTVNENITINFDAGSPGLGDLPEDDTTTTALDPWVEFSQDIKFQQPFYVKSAAIPNAMDAGTNATATLTITPPTTLRQGDLVIVSCQSRNSTTWSIGVTGGQTWTSETAYDRAATDCFCRVFWCVFNGTWSANPRFDSTSSTCTTAFMNVFRGRTTNEIWIEDVAQADVDNAAAATITLTGFSFSGNAANCVALATFATADDNTWSGHDDGRWSTCHYRYVTNSAGSDQSMAAACFTSTTPGEATGNCTASEATLGNDACVTWRMGWRCLDFNILNMPPALPPSNLKGG